jgi:HSP20 family protein
MLIMRFDPFRDLDRIAEQMAGRGMRTIPMEAYRRGDQFVVHFDLPGVRPDDVQLTVEHNVVAIRAERRSPREEGDEVLIDERPQGVFSRQLFLGETLDSEKLEASYDAGVLTLRIPVAEQAKPRRIPIGAGSNEPQPVGASSGRGAG